MLIGKNLPSEFPCFSNIGRWIITDEDHHTHQMVPAEFHFEERRSGELRQSFSPNLAAPLNSLLGLNSTPASACYSNKSPLCGAVAPLNLDLAPRPSGPGPYRGQM